MRERKNSLTNSVIYNKNMSMKTKKGSAPKAFLAPSVNSVMLIGCGGTGGYLAEGLCKIISGYKLDIGLLLVDHDVVEEKNISRQNFMPWEIGMNKAEALALRLSERYATEGSRGDNSFNLDIKAYPVKGEDVQYYPYDKRILLVTCVDKIEPRKHFRESQMWLDAGNSQTQGQAIFGTLCDKKSVKQATAKWDGSPHVSGLPNPYLKVGMKDLTDKARPKEKTGCAEMPFDEQGCFINQMASMSCLIILHQILVKGIVRNPAVYFDFDLGRMIPATITKEYMTL